MFLKKRDINVIVEGDILAVIRTLIVCELLAYNVGIRIGALYIGPFKGSIEAAQCDPRKPLRPVKTN